MPTRRTRRGREPGLLVGPLVITVLVYATLVQLGYFQLLAAHDWVGGRLWKFWLLTPFVGPFDCLQVFTALHVLFAVLVLLRLWSTLRSPARPRWPAAAVLLFCLYPIGQLEYCVQAARTGLAQIEEEPLPSDDELIAKFEGLRPKLEKMLPVFQEWGRTQDPETELHWMSHYRTLDWGSPSPPWFWRKLQRAVAGTNLASGLWMLRDQGSSVYIITNSRGTLPSMWHKGFYFGEKPPSPIFGSLDDHDDAPPGYEAFRRLDGSWYLVVLRDAESWPD